MAIEHTDGMTVVTGSDTMLFHYLQLIHGLTLEITTGMKLSSRGSVMVKAKSVCGSPKQTKKGVLADMVAFTMAEFPQYQPTMRVLRAAGRKYLKSTVGEMQWLRTIEPATLFEPGWTSAKVFAQLRELGALVPAGGYYAVGNITDEMIAFASGN